MIPGAEITCLTVCLPSDSTPLICLFRIRCTGGRTSARYETRAQVPALLRKQHKKWTNTGHTRVCACGLTNTDESSTSGRYRFAPPGQDHVATLPLMSLRAATRTLALLQTITLHRNAQHNQEASTACFEGTTAPIGHLAPRGRLRGRNGDRE